MEKSAAGIRKFKYCSPVTRSRRRKTEKQTTEEDESLEQNEQSLVGEKGFISEQLVDADGPAKLTSGCPSSINLSSGENSSPPPPTTTTSTATTDAAEEQLQSVTSRSKRLRGVTTTNTQHKRVAYTDRKTRSTSSCPIVDARNPIDNNEAITDTLKVENLSNSKNACSKASAGENHEKCLNNIRLIRSATESDKIAQKNVKKSTKLIALPEGESVSGTLENSISQFPSESTITNKSNSGSADWKISTSTNLQCEHEDDNEAVKVIGEESEKRYVVNSNNSFAGDAVNSSINNNNNNTNKIKKIVDEKKLNFAPMLLMNNLPYMGELTFDTRPRRGRKPKKADICHLISKNYGIHFPNSYTNVPNTGCPIPSVSALPNIKSQGKGSTAKGKHTKKNSSSKSSATFSSCPSSTNNWTIPPPDLLPIAMPKPNIKSSTSSLSSSRVRSTSLTKSFIHTSSSSTNKISSTKSINSRNKNNSKSAGSVQEILSASCSANNKRPSQQDEPLNLCVRDASSQIKSQSPQSLSSGYNGGYAGIMNLKLPLISPNSLFSDFHLKSHSSTKSSRAEQNSAVISRAFDDNIRHSTNNNGISVEGNNAMKTSSEKTVGDLSLVNKLSLQLSLANASGNFHGQPSMINKSHGKISHALRFAPPITSDSPSSLLCSKDNQNKKSKKRRSGSLKPDSSNQSEIKSQLSIPSGSSSSSHIFLNPSSVHSTPNVDSHAGGCLFGQPDSGPSSGAQVSICKFKFTGGAKPSLQEKKMLSVDSGGNFRFYTDKCSGSSSIKSIKNCPSGANQSSSTSSFNNTTGESYGEQDCQYAFSSLPKSAKSMSVCMPVRPSSLQLPTPYSQGVVSLPQTSTSSKIIETHPSPSSSIPISPAAVQLNNLHIDSQSRGGGSSSSGAIPYHTEDGYSSSQSDNSNSNSGPSVLHPTSMMMTSTRHYQSDSSRSSKMRSKRKRRTRKSLMREKLEKTFKEKGFLIQTQQLESAEGATYCKFRQLRKFTRYLFRSWKDYLPDNVREINNTGVNEGDGTSAAVNLATSSAGGHRERGGSGMEMEHDLPTTNSHHNGSREDSVDEDNDDDDDEDFEEQEEEEGMDDEHGSELIPEITLTTQPSSPVTTINHHSSSNSSTNNNTDSEASNDVDVENIDGTSDNSSLRYNPTANIIHHVDNDSTADSVDNA